MTALPLDSLSRPQECSVKVPQHLRHCRQAVAGQYLEYDFTNHDIAPCKKRVFPQLSSLADALKESVPF